MPAKTDLDHYLQLRLSRETVTDIDGVIASAPELDRFNRCRFIRYAVNYVLTSVKKNVAGAEATDTVRSTGEDNLKC